MKEPKEPSHVPEDNRPATKQDLLNLEGRLAGKMPDMEDRLVEVMRDVQTTILGAFNAPITEVERGIHP